MAIGHTPGGTGYVIPNDPNHPDVTPSDTVTIASTVDARFREQGAKVDAAMRAAEAVMGMAGIGASSPIDSQTAALVRDLEGDGLALGGGRDLAGVDGVTALDEGSVDGRVETRCHVEAHAVSDVVGRLHAAGVHTLTIQPPSLDDLFLEQYRGEPASRLAGARTSASDGAGSEQR